MYMYIPYLFYTHSQVRVFVVLSQDPQASQKRRRKRRLQKHSIWRPTCQKLSEKANINKQH